MPTNSTSQVIRHLRRVLLPDESGPTDGQLLGCFIERRDEAAFAALVRRHGRLVWGVCRRLLGHHDAEDAFQATFLVLCRKAATIRRREMLASWLYGVAHQTALRAGRTAARRRAREKQVVELPEPAPVEHGLWDDLRPVLDQELSQLPDRYRVVILLCDLEGKTRTEVARQLRLPEGTVGSRLARARGMLAKRLARRGLGVSGGVLAGVLGAKEASASLPASVLSSGIKAARPGAEVVSGRAAVLAERVVKAMFLSKLKAGAAVLFVVALGAATSGLTHRIQAAGQPEAATSEQKESPPRQERTRPEAPPPDAPLPPGPAGGQKPQADKEGQGIKAEVRGTLRFETGRGYFISLKPARKGDPETRVWLRIMEDKVLVRHLEGLQDKEVIAKGKLEQMPAGIKASVPPLGMYMSRFEIGAAPPPNRPGKPRGDEDFLNLYPRFDAFTAQVDWHKQVGKNEIRMSWFRRGNPRVAMVCQADLSASKVTTYREVYDWATQASETHKLGPAQTRILGKLAGRLPPSAAKPPSLEDLILVSVVEKGQPKTYLYDRRQPPRDIVRLSDLTGAGADLDTGRAP